MSVANLVRAMRLVEPERLLIVKAGKFYNYYDADAILMYKIFNYKVLKNEIKDCKPSKVLSGGFPVTNLDIVLDKLEDLKINYYVMDNRNKFEITNKNTFKKNSYTKYYMEGSIIYKNNIAINKLSDELLKNKDNPNLQNEIQRLYDIFISDLKNEKEKNNIEKKIT